MKPAKTFYPISQWILRIAILGMSYAFFFNTFLKFNYKTLDFWTNTLMILFSVLIFFGGFSKKHTLTVVSGMLLMLGAIYFIVMYYLNSFSTGSAIYGVFAALGFYFFTAGNKK